MSRNQLFSVSFVLAALTGACTAPTAESTMAGSSAATSATCSADTDCAAGEGCNSSGFCATLARAGHSCGGNMTTAHPCATGLVCEKRPGQHLPVAEVGGVCEAPASTTAQAGEACGGNMTTAKKCADGLICTPRPGASLPFGDVGGICATPVSGLGGPCGGLASGAATCPEWLQCNSDTSAAGTCAAITCATDWDCPGIALCGADGVCFE